MTWEFHKPWARMREHGPCMIFDWHETREAVLQAIEESALSLGEQVKRFQIVVYFPDRDTLLAKERMSYAKYFKPSELACKHCGADGTKQELRDALDAFREKAGPTIVNCAYRCPVHNALVGGVPDSQHVLGLAADIRVPGATPAQLEAIARTIPAINGIGRADYQGYLHIDVRHQEADEQLAVWCYNELGQVIDYTEVA